MKKRRALLPRNYLEFPLVKVIVSKIAYTALWPPKMYIFKDGPSNIVRENFSENSGVYYVSEICSDWAGLSIAPTPEQFEIV